MQMSKPTYEDLEAQIKHLAAEKEKFAVECAATKIAIAYLKSGRQDFTLNTPSTDAFLAEVRAQGVELYAEHLTRKAIASGANKNHAYAYLAANFAAQLRKGV